MIGLLPTILAQTAEPEGIAALGLDPWGFLAQAITFLSLLLIIKKFALDKIVNVLEERRHTIGKGVTLGIQMEKQKAKLDEQVEDLLRKARKDADKILAQSQAEARQMIADAELSASRQAEIVLEEAQNQIAEDIKRAKQSLKAEMVELVGQATSVIINEKIDAKKDTKIIERLLEGVS